MRNLVIGLAGVLLVNVAQANTISLFDTNGVPITEGESAGAVQYSASCDPDSVICMQGFFDTTNGVSLSNDSGTGYLIGRANPTNELDFLNGLLGNLGSNEPTLTYVNQVDVATDTFTTDRQYFSIKQSTWTAYFLNMSGGSVTVRFDPTTFSHYTEYGLSAIPLPAAAPLFGSAMGLIGLIGWRKRKLAAA